MEEGSDWLKGHGLSKGGGQISLFSLSSPVYLGGAILLGKAISHCYLPYPTHTHGPPYASIIAIEIPRVYTIQAHIRMGQVAFFISLKSSLPARRKERCILDASFVMSSSQTIRHCRSRSESDCFNK